MADLRVGGGDTRFGMLVLESGVPGKGRGLDGRTLGVGEVLVRRRDLGWGFLK